MAMRKVLNPGTRAALVAVAALAWAHSAAAAGSQAALSVRVVVLPAARVQAHSAVKTVLLSAGHVDTRRLEVPGALSASIVTRGSFALELAIIDPEVEKVEVTGLGRPVTLGAAGHREPLMNDARMAALDLSYLVTYLPGVKAGPRPVPVKATFDLL